MNKDWSLFRRMVAVIGGAIGFVIVAHWITVYVVAWTISE